MTEFFLGTHRPNWIHPGRREFKPLGPLFVSFRQIRDRRRSAYPQADTDFAVDSGGFTEIHQAVWNVRAALEAAYELGRKDGAR